MSKENWQVDPEHSSIEFAVMHLRINKIKGSFKQFHANLDFDSADLTTLAVEAVIDSGSLTTSHAQRDEHLKSDDFLDTAKYPDIRFASTGCQKAGEGKYTLEGNLTLHGRIQPVTFHLLFGGLGQDPRGRERAGFHATALIDRRDFGLTFNSPLEAGGIIVGYELAIELNLEALKQD